MVESSRVNGPLHDSYGPFVYQPDSDPSPAHGSPPVLVAIGSFNHFIFQDGFDPGLSYLGFYWWGNRTVLREQRLAVDNSLQDVSIWIEG